MIIRSESSRTEEKAEHREEVAKKSPNIKYPCDLDREIYDRMYAYQSVDAAGRDSMTHVFQILSLDSTAFYSKSR